MTIDITSIVTLVIQVIVLIDYIVTGVSLLGILICDILEQHFNVHFSEKFIDVHVRILIFSTILFLVTLIVPVFTSLFKLLQ